MISDTEILNDLAHREQQLRKIAKELHDQATAVNREADEVAHTWSELRGRETS